LINLLALFGGESTKLRTLSITEKHRAVQTWSGYVRKEGEGKEQEEKVKENNEVGGVGLWEGEK